MLFVKLFKLPEIVLLLPEIVLIDYVSDAFVITPFVETKSKVAVFAKTELLL